MIVLAFFRRLKSISDANAVRNAVNSCALIIPNGILFESSRVTVPGGDVSRVPAPNQAPEVDDRPREADDVLDTGDKGRLLMLADGTFEMSESSCEDIDNRLMSEPIEGLESLEASGANRTLLSLPPVADPVLYPAFPPLCSEMIFIPIVLPVLAGMKIVELPSFLVMAVRCG